MKIIKPQKISLQYRVLEDPRGPVFVATAFLFFPLDQPSALLGEIDLWKCVAGELGKEAIFDMGMPKTRGEVLVFGACHTPGGVPRPACPVRVRVGSMSKTVSVFGNRYWKKAGGLVEIVSQPEPFTVMPIIYENAFGGSEYPPNPLGKGFRPMQSNKGEIHPLPNVEDPQQLIGSKKDIPGPAGLGPLDLMWPQRSSKAGTYDRKWLEDRFPGFAADMDPTIFNAAPSDQWIEGYFRGGESITVENMHPDKPLLSARLPEMAIRCFINCRKEDGEEFREIPTRMETVCLFPHIERGILIFRGAARVAEDDAADVLQLLAGCETLKEPKGAEHYRSVLLQRMDKEQGFLFALRDENLLPRDLVTATAGREEKDPIEDLVKTEGFLHRNQRVKAEKELEKARQKIIDAGLDPAKYNLPAALPPEPEVPESPDLIMAMALDHLKTLEQAKSEAEAKKGQAEQEAREACRRMGMDYDLMLEEAKKKAKGKRPGFSADEVIEKIRNAAEMEEKLGGNGQVSKLFAGETDLENKLRQAEQNFNEMYRANAQHFPPFADDSSEHRADMRRQFLSQMKAGQTLSGKDFCGADLSALDLRGIDLSTALLEEADFSASDLSGANLAGAILARANFSKAVLRGVKAEGANFGCANLTGADFSEGSNLSRAVLEKADLTGADFHGADLTKANLTEAVFSGTNMSGVVSPELLFLKTNLAGTAWVGADLSKANFIEADLQGADFSKAALNAATFVKVKGDKASFCDADLTNARITGESSFSGADFSGARMDRAYLRGTALLKARFARAHMDDADLSECMLNESDFYRALAHRAKFEKADLTNATLVSVNLMQGSLRKARFYGADFRGSNLFEVDFEKAQGDRATDFSEANLKRTRLAAWSRG